MNLDAMQDILAASRREGKPMWQIVLETDMENRGVTARESLEKMAKTWRAMVEASDAYAGQRRSHSGLAGGQGEQMREYAARGGTIGGDFTAQVIAEALAMGESNACMRRIVAAPTAGACGVMPAVLIPLWRRENIPEERCSWHPPGRRCKAPAPPGLKRAAAPRGPSPPPGPTGASPGG